jgi:hypothetical protein
MKKQLNEEFKRMQELAGIKTKISYEEAEDILSNLRDNEDFQYDVFGKIEDNIRDEMGDDFDEDDVYDQAVTYMLDKLIKQPNIWDKYL